MLRIGLIVTFLLVMTACGGYDPPDPLTLRAVPQPDLCRALKVEKALTAPVASCTAAPGADQFGARFGGVHTVRAKGKKPEEVRVAILVAYRSRFDPKDGFDLWARFGAISGDRGAVIGLGEASVFDPKTRMMAAVSDGLIISASFQSPRPLLDATLPDRLLDVMQQAIELGRRPVTQSSPDRIRTSPEIPM
ncbi:hypothetical protein [Actinocorallia lasiicapitis]